MSGVLAILGPGTLGLSTAQWAVACGFSVRLLGRDLSHAEAGVRAIHDRWEREAAAGRLHPEAHTRGLDLLQAGTLGTASLAGATCSSSPGPRPSPSPGWPRRRGRKAGWWASTSSCRSPAWEWWRWQWPRGPILIG